MRTWKNWRACRLTARGWVVLVAVMVAPLVYTATQPTAQPQPEKTLVNYYESPCYYEARTSRGIPPLMLDQATGLIAWERNHQGTPEAADYHAALKTCDATAPVEKWNWDGMWLAHSERAR